MKFQTVIYSLAITLACVSAAPAPTLTTREDATTASSGTDTGITWSIDMLRRFLMD
ncbi:hypothetical protein E8E14_013362 [Neopestalotiopsis sp. 37M]|nr:hypothetical protein E8E14_013362 [Neopestalotiopsis sp. 37M]